MRLTPFRQRNPIVVGIVSAVIMGALVLGVLNWDRLPVVGAGQTYTAEFSEAAGLAPGDEVRVAGVDVGEVTDVELATDRVMVTFRVQDTWLGQETAAAITIKTVLGQKNLSLDPLGEQELAEGETIPLERTITPLDVTDAFDQLGEVLGTVDSEQLAEAFTTLGETFSASTPEDVRTAFTGLAALSETIAERDEELARLLENTDQLSNTLAGHNDQFEALINDGAVLLRELDNRREAISALLSGTRAMSEQLSGLVADNEAEIGPMLERLERVTEVLRRNQANLDESLRLAGPYYRLMGDVVRTDRWVDSYICGLVEGGDGGCVPPRSGGEG
ncbi:MCE family protein [Haloechinothrix sp. LS1_15]|uniref:MCE family protein n=1 Tax=Haloechinothrix sp. LS1_15 TaxID=2652248 RepID=UPI0029443BBD|nr:MCE family protein [Haloechinothrix sp. LS1_15]MDV6014319.1 MCE family protein [Haloechinothrix sp. LS1_15]